MLNQQKTEENPFTNLSLMEKIKRRYDLTPSISLILGLTTLFFVIFLIYPLLYVTVQRVVLSVYVRVLCEAVLGTVQGDPHNTHTFYS